jgi:hypothetical protein
VDGRFGANTADVLAADADGVAGSYWRVWETVYHANLVRQETGGPPLWGVGERCGPWRHRWGEPHRVYRVAVFPAPDPRNGRSGLDEFAESCERYGLWLLEFEPVERRGRVAVYLVTPR